MSGWNPPSEEDIYVVRLARTVLFGTDTGRPEVVNKDVIVKFEASKVNSPSGSSLTKAAPKSMGAFPSAARMLLLGPGLLLVKRKTCSSSISIWDATAW